MIKLSKIENIQDQKIQTMLFNTICNSYIDNIDKEEFTAAILYLSDPPMEFKLEINKQNKQEIKEMLLKKLMETEEYETISKLQENNKIE